MGKCPSVSVWTVMVLSFKVALQLNLKQFWTEVLGSPSWINNGSGKQLQIYRAVINGCRGLDTPLTPVCTLRVPRSSCNRHLEEITELWSHSSSCSRCCHWGSSRKETKLAGHAEPGPESPFFAGEEEEVISTSLSCCDELLHRAALKNLVLGLRTL